ncbi:MAG: SRPBCC family protein [Bacteroidetes bacterium]|jgi:ligand-binding SRPBCC domain-containing protein|nr:SRPBCC family protein [Bacteroidota bacterium]
MASYSIKRDHIVDTTVEELWAFLVNPNNLQKLTPKKFGGKRLDKNATDIMSEGSIATYRIKVFPFIHVKWKARFFNIILNESFIDEQVSGPFKSWTHKHSILVHQGNVIMRDEITFEPPFPWFGDYIYVTFIVGRLHKLFTYRDDYFDAHFKQSEL